VSAVQLSRSLKIVVVGNDSQTTRSGFSMRSKLAVGSHARVKFIGFWPGFDPFAYFVPLLRSHPFSFDVEVCHSGSCDIEIHSVFNGRRDRAVRRARRRIRRLSTGRTHAKLDDAKTWSSKPLRVWFTGENVRPPVGKWDATLSFDADSWTSNNAYFPLWWQMFPELVGERSGARPGIVPLSRFQPLETFMSNRHGQAGRRDLFACAIISNPEPMRLRAIEALGQIGKVDVLGRVVGRPIEDKFEVFSRYQFALCFENDLYPGYVTEKVFDAWGAGSIPLWWGIDRGGYLDDRAFLNLAAHENIDSFVTEVAQVQRSTEVMDRMSSHALLRIPPNLDEVRRILAAALLSGNETP